MWKLRRSLGLVALATLLFVILVDVGSYYGWTPVLCAPDNKFAVFTYCGNLSIEWAGDHKILNLASMGHPLWRIGINSNDWPYAAVANRGQHLALELIELPLLITSVALLLGPIWARRLRRHEGRCPQCEYRVLGISSEHCPECGNPIPNGTLREIDKAPTSRFSFGVRRTVFPYVFAFAAWIVFHVLLGCVSPSRQESFDALNALPGIFMVESREHVRLRTKGGTIEFTLGDTANSACKWAATWTPDDAATAHSSGALSEIPPVVTQFTVGPTTLKWSIGDATHHWIYLPSDATHRIEGP